jgi:hypothetical protein
VERVIMCRANGECGSVGGQAELHGFLLGEEIYELCRYPAAIIYAVLSD